MYLGRGQSVERLNFHFLQFGFGAFGLACIDDRAGFLDCANQFSICLFDRLFVKTPHSIYSRT